jgi:phthalate 4,5-cis-dihydrodiol dehydrogenase
MIGVGIIGAGWWAGEHARAVRAVPGLRLAAFSSRSAERVAAFAGEFGVAGETDYRRLLERPDVEVVAIATPHDTHARLAVEALAAGKHVLLEKPMARDRAECAAIAEAAEKSDKLCMVGFTHHFIPAVAATKGLVERGEIGAVVAAFCAHTQVWGWERRPSFYRERALGGGVWLTLGVHFVDRFLWLIDSEVVAVKASIARRFHQPEEHNADDAATVQFQFANGAAGTIVVAGQRNGPTWSEMRLIGERGMIRLDGHGLSIAGGDEWRAVAVPEGNPMALEWAAFARAIAEGTPPPVTLDHALRVMEAVFAAEESAATGLEVRIGTGAR